MRLEKIDNKSFSAIPEDENITQGQKIILDGELEFEDNVDPEKGQEFLAKVAYQDGEYILLSVNGIPVVTVEETETETETEAETEEGTGKTAKETEEV